MVPATRNVEAAELNEREPRKNGERGRTEQRRRKNERRRRRRVGGWRTSAGETKKDGHTETVHGAPGERPKRDGTCAEHERAAERHGELGLQDGKDEKGGGFEGEGEWEWRRARGRKRKRAGLIGGGVNWES